MVRSSYQDQALASVAKCAVTWNIEFNQFRNCNCIGQVHRLHTVFVARIVATLLRRCCTPRLSMIREQRTHLAACAARSRRSLAAMPSFVGSFLQDRRAPQGAPGCNVYVRGLQEKLTDEDLATMFAVSALPAASLQSQHSALRLSDSPRQDSFCSFAKSTCASQGCGRIVSSKLLRDPEGGTRGVGFVQFAVAEDAARAISEMDGRKASSCQWRALPIRSACLVPPSPLRQQRAE